MEAKQVIAIIDAIIKAIDQQTPNFKKGGMPHKPMKKYKVVSDCLRWPKGTEIELIRLTYTRDESFYAQGVDGLGHIPDSIMQELIARGLVEKIEEERVKDYAIIGEDYNACMPIHKWITAVRRLSDGVEVKVGQDFTIDILGTTHKITGFKESMGRMYVLFEGGSARLNRISPLPEKKVLFTTEDGVKVYKGDTCYFVNKIDADYAINEWRAREGCRVDHVLEFSTREAAEEWVIKNKPNVFSWEDVSQAHHDPFDIMEYDEWIIMTGRKRLGFPQPNRDNRPRAKCPY